MGTQLEQNKITPQPPPPHLPSKPKRKNKGCVTLVAFSNNNKLINFKAFISTNGILLNIHYFSHTIIYFFDLEEINFENFNISENNIN